MESSHLLRGIIPPSRDATSWWCCSSDSNADICEKQPYSTAILIGVKRVMYIFIYRLMSKFKLLNRTLRRAEQFGPVRATSQTLNQLYADPNNGSVMWIYVPNVESLNAMPISAHHLFLTLSTKPPLATGSLRNHSKKLLECY